MNSAGQCVDGICSGIGTGVETIDQDEWPTRKKDMGTGNK